MIHRLRRKFIRICTLSFLSVFAAMFLILVTANYVQKNRFMDTLADTIAENGGTFPKPTPEREDVEPPPSFSPGMDAETPFSTRFFTVTVDDENNVTAVNIEAVSSIAEEDAADYAAKALKRSKTRGWVDDYRYKIYEESGSTTLVFVNGNAMKAMSDSNIAMVSAVFGISGAVMLLFIIVFSGKAARPAAESYEKQKQFVTDVNHELKTPLTLILTNIDIAETELGKNEWLDDIRSEGQRMNGLVNRLVTLSRMDEADRVTDAVSFSLSNAAADTVAEFAREAQRQGKTLSAEIAEGISYIGKESEIRQLIAILLDNAVKYCDPNGTIDVILRGGKHVVFQVENSCAAVQQISIPRLFDRFYREDPARTPGNSFGIGLSIAKAIAVRHHAELHAFAASESRICFRVRF